MTLEGRPPPTAGLRHVALFARDFEATVRFYTEVMGMRIEWRPDADNCYLTNGNDNLALHRATTGNRQRTRGSITSASSSTGSRMWTPGTISWWPKRLKSSIRRGPIATARAVFYCRDPEGTSVQLIYHPPLSRGRR